MIIIAAETRTASYSCFNQLYSVFFCYFRKEGLDADVRLKSVAGSKYDVIICHPSFNRLTQRKGEETVAKIPGTESAALEIISSQLLRSYAARIQATSALLTKTKWINLDPSLFSNACIVTCDMKTVFIRQEY